MLENPARPHSQDVPRKGETLDSICGGDVRVFQRTHGYRFNLDPLLLSHFIGSDCRGSAPVIDLGTGSGIVALVLARRFAAQQVLALELQESLFELAARNVRLNACERQISVLKGDLRDASSLFAAGSFGRVVSNPPYRPVRQGRLSPEPEKALAKHELGCELSDVVRAAEHLLSPGGIFAAILPASRVAEATTLLQAARLEPRRLCFVHPVPGRAAKRVLIDAVKRGRGELRVLPPLYLHESAGGPFTPAVRAITDGTAEPGDDFA